MPLEQVGVRAVIEGLGSYLGGARQMADATAQIGAAAQRSAQHTDDAGRRISGFGGILRTAAGTALGFVAANVGMRVISGAFNMIGGSIVGMSRTKQMGWYCGGAPLSRNSACTMQTRIDSGPRDDGCCRDSDPGRGQW